MRSKLSIALVGRRVSCTVRHPGQWDEDIGDNIIIIPKDAVITKKDLRRMVDAGLERIPIHPIRA